MTDTIHIDGAEGGGQLLRSALSLSLVTGRRFRMTNIRRARKPKSGLMRQHLTCVTAAAEVGEAAVDGAEIGSHELVFAPGCIRAGDYRFAIGSGGSAMLVLQTLLPALWHADAPSTVRVEGGTHNPLAPPFEFVEQCFLPAVAAMGAKASLTLERHGFMQAGGGAVHAAVTPVNQWLPLNLVERGELISEWALILNSFLAGSIVDREVKSAMSVLNWPRERFQRREITDTPGPGNAVLLGAKFAGVCEITSGIAQMGASAETVGHRAAKSLRNYLASEAPVGVHLADQLLLPMALGKGGVFRTLPLSRHSQSNMALIQQFLPVTWRMEDLGEGVWEASCEMV